MSVMSTGRRPGAAVRRLSPEDAYLLPRRPGAAGGGARTSRRPGRPRLRLVPPLTTGPAEHLPPAPPRGRTSASADARVPAPRAGSVPRAAHPPMAPPAPAAPPAPKPAPVAPAPAAARAQVAGLAQGLAPARVVRPAYGPAGRGLARRRVRLTRRGRLVVWVLAALTVAAVLIPVWLLAASGAQAANHGLPPAAVHAGLRQIVVRPGQTLWSVAMAAEPAADPRVITQEIMQVNALSSQVLVPGETLWVPAR
jgi:LysM domain